MFSKLIGKTITEIEKVLEGDDITELIIKCADGSHFRLHHEQDCCEYVYVEDITGDLEDLIGRRVLDAHETSNHEGVREGRSYLSETWTFYHITSLVGSVCVRWCGSSNGYYSEEVNVTYTEGEDLAANKNFDAKRAAWENVLSWSRKNSKGG